MRFMFLIVLWLTKFRTQLLILILILILIIMVLQLQCTAPIIACKKRERLYLRMASQETTKHDF
jgi:hypothetical protein